MKVIPHQFSNEDFYVPSWKVKYLFLGTFNPTGGAKVNYYYGRAKNQTWATLSLIFKCNFDPKDGTFKALLETHQIACMDLIHELRCPLDRIDTVLGKGYKDTAIINNSVVRNYNTLAIQNVIKNNPGIKVYSTWGKGSNLKNWTNEIRKLGSITALVSPSLAAKVPEGTEKIASIVNDWTKKIKISEA